MDLVDIVAATHCLGFERTSLDPEAAEGVSAFLGGGDIQDLDGFWSRFSEPREVSLPAFRIARTTVPLATLVGDPYSLPDTVEDLAGLCDLVDAALRSRGLRVPLEDELEAALGGQRFFWGNELPRGAFSSSNSRLLQPTPSGLVVDGDPYQVELARTALMLGDGGESVCGGYEWPVAWLCLSPSWRLRDAEVQECFIEFLEGTHVRPVTL